MLCNVRQPLKCAQDSYTRGTWAEFVLVPVPAPRFISLLQLQKSARTSMPLGESHLCNQPGDLNLTRRVFLPQQIDSQLTREMHLAWVSPLADLKLGNIIQNSILPFKDRTEEYVKLLTHNTFCIKFSNLINLVEDKMSLNLSLKQHVN